MALGGCTIVDFGMVTRFTVPRGDLYFGASQGSGFTALYPFSGTMMSDCANAGTTDKATISVSSKICKGPRIISLR